MITLGLARWSVVIVALLQGCAGTPSPQPNSAPPAETTQTVVKEPVTTPPSSPMEAPATSDETPAPKPTPMLSVAQAQTKLNALGYKVGAADGKIGAKTRAALKSFQRKHGIAVTGELDAATSEKLSE